ncbi:class I SAM-dependent methyltransferase [Arcanobacterium ihumii]|uniref:class I SAM-dependent methyltransferase n=1 Tax=Arcanobacterium ihumii TaxID=2138162 RepID=UPI001F315D18|nr:methyltransferase [Arcanobacterium ihumii]
MSDHYFSSQPDSDVKEHRFNLEIRGNEFSIHTQNGVFSTHGLDKGTAVLLSKVPSPQVPSGALAVDLGCGWGPITLALATEAPNAVVLGVDINERAMALAAENIATNHVKNASIDNSKNAYQRLKDSGQTIDLMWSNPPIRIGKTELHELLSQWFDLLSPQGKAFIVVQKNLGADSLARWITKNGYTVEKIGSSKGFRVFEISR